MPQKANSESSVEEQVTVENAPPRPPQADPGNTFNALAWLMEGATGLLSELRHPHVGLPAQFWSHAHAARKEGLLALRTLLDEAIARSEQKAEKAQAAEQ